jgi:hypothetical protein
VFVKNARRKGDGKSPETCLHVRGPVGVTGASQRVTAGEQERLACPEKCLSKLGVDG